MAVGEDDLLASNQNLCRNLCQIMPEKLSENSSLLLNLRISSRQFLLSSETSIVNLKLCFYPKVISIFMIRPTVHTVLN